jgi:hypothetical protein
MLFVQDSYSFQCFAWLCNPIGTCVMTKWWWMLYVECSSSLSRTVFLYWRISTIRSFFSCVEFWYLYMTVRLQFLWTHRKYVASVPRQPHLLGKGCSCIWSQFPSCQVAVVMFLLVTRLYFVNISLYKFLCEVYLSLIRVLRNECQQQAWFSKSF